jgi:leucine-rich repeat protein SHOC2
LNGLTLDKSWSLLKNIITYGDETKCVNQTLESIGKKIAEKSSGVPLAIRTLGGLLQGKTEEREWINVLQGDFWKLCEDEESIMPVLKLSYQNLSPQLRQCFAYCSLYPKDWKILKDELIQLWVSQGYFECPGGNKPMEDIGNQFVNIFLMKSFFQDAEIDDCGNICSFKMHDLIHDLAMQVACNDCCYLDSERNKIVGSPMHVMLKSDDIGLLKSVDASRMRTLILLSNNQEIWYQKELSVISKFKYLRVLKLSCSLSMLCESIGKLRHLRYFNLAYCEGGRSLLKYVSNIVCLQTLILEECEEVEFSTKDVSNLINLRQLIIQNLTASTGGIFSNWFSSLTYIVEISLYICHDLEHLPPMERLPFLKSLYIHYLPELECLYYEEPLLPEKFFPSLENLTFISCKKLRGWVRMKDSVIDDDDDDTSSQSNPLSFPPFSARLSHFQISFCPRLTRVPTFPKLDKTLSLTYSSSVKALEATLNMIDSQSSIEVPPLSLIKYLNLVHVDLDVKKFPKNWVQNLTSLEHLVFGKLPSQTFQEIKISFKENFNYLPSLRNIEFCLCSHLKTLPHWICNLTSLQHITIKDCENLASLPERMPHLAKLQTLEIIECPLLLEECETQTSATWPKIAHIPNIILKRFEIFYLKT